MNDTVAVKDLQEVTITRVRFRVTIARKPLNSRYTHIIVS